VVLATHSFVGRSVEILRKQLVEEERQRRPHIEAERLQTQANEIAQIINQDYSEYQRRFSTANNGTPAAPTLC
jgi:predicted secreted Zn-dependent protease